MKSHPQRARPLLRPALVVRCLAFYLGLASWSLLAAERITIKGSDTMVILGQRWAEQYMKPNPGVVIQVAAGGSGMGFSALINGTTDICFASRPMSV